MARVPVRRNFEVLPGGGSSGRMQVAAPSTNYAADNARRVGTALQQVGGDLGKHAQEQAARLNEARVRDGALQFRAAAQEAEAEYQKLKGAELVAGDKPMMREIEAQLEQRRSDILKTMKNDDARFAFEEASSRQLARYRERAAAYEAEQAEFYVNQQRDAVIVASMETSLSDPARRDESLASANATIREKFADEGYDGDRLDQLSQDAFGEFAGTNIETLIEQGEAEKAAAYLESAKPYLAGSAATAMQSMVDEAVSARKTLSLADRVFDEFNPDEFGRDAPKADIYAYAREIVGDDPEDLKALMAEVDMRIRLYEDQAGDAYAADFDEAYELAMTEPGRIQGLPAFRRLDAKDRDSLLQEVKRRSKGEATETNLQEYATVMDLLDAGQTREARDYLYANASQFEPTDFKSLRGKVSSAVGGDAETIDSVRSVTASARDAARMAGLKDDPETRAEITQAYDEWQMDFQKREGRQPSDEERDTRISQLAAKIKLRRPGVFNDPEASVYTFDEDVGDVPPAYAQAIMGRAAGRGVTEINERELNIAYARAMQAFIEGGVPDPSPDAVADMVEALALSSVGGAQ